MRLVLVCVLTFILLATTLSAFPPGCGGSVSLSTTPPGVYIVPPGVSVRVNYNIYTATNTTCVRVKGSVEGALEKVSGGFHCGGGYIIVRAKNETKKTGTIRVSVLFKCKYKKGNETKTETFTRSASLTLLVDHYAEIKEIRSPKVALIGHRAAIWVTVSALASAKDVKLWFNWTPSSKLILFDNETPGWVWAGEGGYVSLGDMSYRETKVAKIVVYTAEKGNVTLSFWLDYGGWWDGAVLSPKVVKSMLITDVGMDVPDTELYLTAKAEPYVIVYPNVTTYIYVFSSYRAHVTITISTTGPGTDWQSKELDLEPDTFLAIPLSVTGAPGNITVKAVFDSLDPLYPFHYEFEDLIVVKRVSAYALPPVRFNPENDTIDVDYTVLGTPKSLYLVVRYMNYWYGEKFPTPREMNITTIVVPVPPCKKGRVCTAHIPLPEPPQIDTPEQALYALRSAKGVMVSALWYDSGLGYVESVPVPGYVPYLMTGGAAVELNPSTIRLIVFGYSDAVLNKVKIKTYYWYKGKVHEDEFDGYPSYNTFLAWKDYSLPANGTYTFLVEVYAEGTRKATRFIVEVAEEEVSYEEELPPGINYNITISEAPLSAAKEIEFKIPLYGAAQIVYNGAPPPEPIPTPMWMHSVLTLALGLALFFISLAGFLVVYRQAPESVVEWASKNMVYVLLAFIGVASASNIFPTIWQFIGEIYGVPNYGEPYNVVLIYVTASSMFLSAIAAGIVESIFSIGMWAGIALAIVGAVLYALPKVGIVINVAGSMVFEKFGDFVEKFVESSTRILPMILSSASILYVVGLTASYIMYFIYMFGPLLALAGLALSTLPPFRRAGLSLFLFFTFLYAFLPVFTAPAIRFMKHTVVSEMIPALQSLNSGVLSRLGEAVKTLGDIFLNYFLFLFPATAPSLGTPAALVASAIGSMTALTVYIAHILYAMCELYLGIVIAFFTAYGFSRALSGATLTGLSQLMGLGRLVVYKLLRTR